MAGPIRPFKRTYEIPRKKGQTIFRKAKGFRRRQGIGGQGRLKWRGIASPKN